MADPSFQSDLDFCPECGTILPRPGLEKYVVCRNCDFQISVHRLVYDLRQTRLASEGQTVSYTCMSCRCHEKDDS
ncbi:DNA-directed RNA polymerase I subunit RPA12-like [Carcharodon carcharias]|uniref:DNA-directed RNA polymerase I subunit RPA12-like n=1 Tax=Carcharodon carcharias TaxID=13397 RepID=UPI001B7F48CF|nr:DNA-directed RNA polymerase I subunit RPA12-like [Carcharodon carcharias]